MSEMGHIAAILQADVKKKVKEFAKSMAFNRKAIYFDTLFMVIRELLKDLMAKNKQKSLDYLETWFHLRKEEE